MIEKTSISFGPDSRNRLQDAGDPSDRGTEAALETFYYAFHNRDLDALGAVWADSLLTQLNNPVGGILRGADAIVGLYSNIFRGAASVQVTFTDVISYQGREHAMFAGREIGSYTAGGGRPVPLEIRTSRYFRYEDGRWRQYHHHGSIDDPAVLQAYQQAFRG
jgi:ketosteroid isomerase-like protein